MGSGRTYLTTRILPLPEAKVWRESPRLPRRRDPRSPALPPLRQSPLPSPRRFGREALPPTTSLLRHALRTDPRASNAAACSRKPALLGTNSPGMSMSSSWPSSSPPPGRGEQPSCCATASERLSFRATASERLSARLRVFGLLRACPPDRARFRPSSCRRRNGRSSASLLAPPFLPFSPLQPPSPTGLRRASDHTIPSLSRRVEARGRPR